MNLGPDRALIFRITHIDNLNWDLENGLRCRSSAKLNPTFRQIGNLELITKRKDWPVPIPPGGTLSDYVPFYFTSRSPMLYNIRTGHGGITRVPMADIVVYVASLRNIESSGTQFVFTDRHAKLEIATFSSDLANLDQLDWKILSTSDFEYDPNDPEKMDRYQAEALIHRTLPCDALSAILCYNESAKSVATEAVRRNGFTVQCLVKPRMFFG